MQQIQHMFEYAGSVVRMVIIDGDPWFVAKDVCEVLGISDARKSVGLLDEDERNTIPVTDSLGREQLTWIINEPGLYSLILRSRKPEARDFKRTVTHEVLPSIRKHGAYFTPTKLEDMLRDPDTMIQLLTEFKREREEKERLQLETARQADVIEEQAERLTYLDEIMRSEDTLTISQIAADYGLTARQLNAVLKEAGVQRKTGGQWILCARYLRRGLTKSVTHAIPLDGGGTKTVLHTRWTQAGRLLIHQTLAERGIQANRDRGIDPGVLVIRPAAQVERREPTEIKLSLRINA